MHSYKLVVLLGILFTLAIPLTGANIQVIDVETVVQRYPEEKRGINLTVRWDHSWQNDKNHDAAWVFLKSLRPGGGYIHVPLRLKSARLLWKGSPDMPDPTINISADHTGMFVYPSEEYRGPVTYRIFVEQASDLLDEDTRIARGSVLGYGIEMVYIPEGGFTLGDPKESALDFYAFYQSGPDGSYNGLYTIEEEAQDIPVGPEEGQLYYRSNSAEYRGDQAGPIPASFPKGVRAFYLMKYEVTQGIYADFLNSLRPQQASVRYPGGTPAYAPAGGTLKLDNDQFIAERPEQRMNFLHWDDMMAFMDWAALRPYTELEYTKACRGPGEPKPNEYAWNTGNQDLLARKIDPLTNYMEMQRDLDEGDLTDANRAVYGASYYWVFDLSGSMWEKVITVGDPIGRSFRGQHGDGTITSYGFADVEGWPRGFADSEGGYGYRGGGHYGEPWIGEGNPFSPIAHRPYAAWSGGPRNNAYGTRAGRTAPFGSRRSEVGGQK